MADQLKSRFDLPTVELESGDRGEFSVWVGGQCVAKKSASGYPDTDTVMTAVGHQLA